MSILTGILVGIYATTVGVSRCLPFILFYPTWARKDMQKREESDLFDYVGGWGFFAICLALICTFYQIVFFGEVWIVHYVPLGGIYALHFLSLMHEIGRDGKGDAADNEEDEEDEEENKRNTTSSYDHWSGVITDLGPITKTRHAKFKKAINAAYRDFQLDEWEHLSLLRMLGARLCAHQKEPSEI